MKNDDDLRFLNQATSVSPYYRPIPARDLSSALQPLLMLLKTYDARRQRLEKHGGEMHDIQALTYLLTQKIVLRGGQNFTVSLCEPETLAMAIQEMGGWDLHLQVRQLANHFPVYYLSRRWEDLWCTYSLLVEDLYLSPGYSLEDGRFIKLMHWGHETFFLRLSPFRDGVKEMLNHSATPEAVDQVLHHLGRYVLQAAWHEDQRPAMLIAQHFKLKHFLQAIELLYLCLGADLCALRSAVQPSMIRFFEQVYQQPALSVFLRLLPTLDGAAIDDLPDKALRYYTTLTKAFNHLLETSVQDRPIYKWIFGNFSRLETVAIAFREDRNLRKAAKRLETQARTVIDEMTTDSRSSKPGTTV